MLNRLVALNSSLGGSFSFGYDVLGRRTSLTRPNGVNTAYSYDQLSRLLAILHQQGEQTVDGAGYGYDNAGNRLNKGNFLDGSMEQYTYDPVYQLTQVIRNNTITEAYTYDQVGNRLTSLYAGQHTYNSSNQLLSTSAASFAFDYNGNTTSKTNANGTTTYTWDYENRLTSVTLPGTGGTVTFKYDPFGRRIQKSGPLGTVNFLYDGANAVADVDTGGAFLARYVQGAGIDEPLSLSTANGNSFFEADGLGSVTSLSSIGGVTDTYTYKPFGITTANGTTVNRFRYTGREWDQETGLYYYRARYYDPQAGRFISEDPIQFQGGINFYRYVRNNPINLTDPLGLCPKDKTDCFLQAFGGTNGVALGLDLLGYIPVTDVVTAAIQIGVGSASTVNSAISGNTPGAFMGIGGVHVAGLTPMALDAGGSLAKAVPGFGTFLNTVSLGMDAWKLWKDYQKCLSGQ